MTETAEKLKRELSQLSEEDREALADFLYASLGRSVEPRIDDAWDAELARRLERIESGEDVGKPAEEVMARLRKKSS